MRSERLADRRVDTIGALVRDGVYPVDEESVAAAICARMVLRGLAVTAPQQDEGSEPRVRSFHATRHAPSFRLCGSGRRR